MSVTPGTTDEILAFIDAAKKGGMADDFAVTLLRKNGWPDKRIFQAFSTYYAGTLSAAVPKAGGTTEGARDAFLYLINFISLAFWSIALGKIFYVLIAHWLPDPVRTSYEGYGYGTLLQQLSWPIAATIVGFIIFAFAHAAIARELHRRRELYDSGVRRWLTYIALVICVVVVALDAMWFVQSLLLGQLTARFLFDTLVLLVIGGGIFTYYQATMNAPRAVENSTVTQG